MTLSPDSIAIASVLVAGHAVGDFVLQSDGMVRSKNKIGGIALHSLVVAACHAGFLLPFYFGTAAVAAVGAVAAGHFIIDTAKGALSRHAPDRALRWFVLDQAAHVGVLAAAWYWLIASPPPNGMIVAAPASLATAAVYVSAYAFNWNGVSAIVGTVLGNPRADSGGRSAGRTIGRLERMFALTLILLDRWEALGLLIAAKSLARFKALDDRELAEYYLVGTLLSLLGATATALVVRSLLLRI